MPESELQSRIELNAQTARKAERKEAAASAGGLLETQPAQGQPSLLRLQRRHGNRFVQRLLALARKGDGPFEAGSEVEEGIRRAKGGGQALDGGARARMEPAMGADFSGVRVHTGAEADDLNRAVNARAFTVGQDVFFRQGEYRPGSSAGRELLAHELTHVMQQGGAAEMPQGKLTVGAAGDQYEQEADQVAGRVMRETEGIQRQAEEDEDQLQGKLLRQAEEDKDEAQAKLLRQPEEEEEKPEG